MVYVPVLKTLEVLLKMTEYLWRYSRNVIAIFIYINCIRRLSEGTVVTPMSSKIIVMESASKTIHCSVQTLKVYRYCFTMMKLRYVILWAQVEANINLVCYIISL